MDRNIFQLLAAAGLAMACAPADGSILSWNNAAGGSAALSTSWSPAQVPVAADDLTFNLVGAYTVTWPNTVSTSRTQTYRKGTVTAIVSSPHTVTNGITIGDTNALTGTLTLTTGTLNSTASVVLGSIAGSVGVLNVDDDDADFIVTGATADLTVGGNGDAALSITGGGLVQVAHQFVLGNNASSSPTLTVSGAQSISPFQRSRLLVLGTNQSRFGQGGDATVNISNGALADFAGDLVVSNGSASISTVTLAGGGGIGGILDATLDVAGDLLLGRNTSAGSPGGTATVNVNANGALIVGGALFIAGDPDGGTAAINLNGGIVTADATLGAQGTLTGNGTLNGTLTMSGGTLSPSGTGLEIAGTLLNTLNTGISGNHLHFTSSGSYVGSGTCSADITGDSSALIHATGPLSIGRATTSGFSYNGAIVLGTNSVTLVDSNGAVLGGQTNIGTGTLACANGIGNQNGARIFGDGRLTGNVTNSGIIDPENADDNLGATLDIQGNLSCNQSGVMDFEIGGPPQSAFNDRVNVTGTAAFGGTVRVRFRPGFVPRPGQQFILCNATGGRTGEFVINDLPPDPCPVYYRPVIVYSGTAAICLVTNGFCDRVDFNCDGSHDPDDLADYLGAFFAVPAGEGTDFSGDGTTDPDDLADYIGAFFSCT